MPVQSVPPFIKDQIRQVADKKNGDAMPFVSDVMDDNEYNQTWVKSLPRKGRSDEEMRALEPSLDAYRLDPKSDLVTYHKKGVPMS